MRCSQRAELRVCVCLCVCACVYVYLSVSLPLCMLGSPLCPYVSPCLLLGSAPQQLAEEEVRRDVARLSYDISRLISHGSRTLRID